MRALYRSFLVTFSLSLFLVTTIGAMETVDHNKDTFNWQDLPSEIKTKIGSYLEIEVPEEIAFDFDEKKIEQLYGPHAHDYHDYNAYYYADTGSRLITANGESVKVWMLEEWPQEPKMILQIKLRFPELFTHAMVIARKNLFACKRKFFNSDLCETTGPEIISFFDLSTGKEVTIDDPKSLYEKEAAIWRKYSWRQNGEGQPLSIYGPSHFISNDLGWGRFKVRKRFIPSFDNTEHFLKHEKYSFINYITWYCPSSRIIKQWPNYLPKNGISRKRRVDSLFAQLMLQKIENAIKQGSSISLDTQKERLYFEMIDRVLQGKVKEKIYGKLVHWMSTKME